jgi:hypothetical protein
VKIDAAVLAPTYDRLDFGNGYGPLRANLHTGLTAQALIHFNRFGFTIHQFKHRSRTTANTLFTAGTGVFIDDYFKHIILLAWWALIVP